MQIKENHKLYYFNNQNDSRKDKMKSILQVLRYNKIMIVSLKLCEEK